jgi:hypothetical protein
VAGSGRDDRREDAQKRNASVYVFMTGVSSPTAWSVYRRVPKRAVHGR